MEVTKATVTISADSMPLGVALRHVQLETGVSFVVSSDALALPVTCAAVDQPVDVVVGALASSAGADAVWRSSSLCFVGSTGQDDHAVMFRRVRRGSVEDARAIAGIVLTTEGGHHVTSDGVLVAGDRLQSLVRLYDLMADIESLSVPVWLVEVFAVRDYSTRTRNLSVAPEISGRIGASVDPSSVVTPIGAAEFAAYIEAVSDDRESELAVAPAFALAAGETGRMATSEERSILRRETTADGRSVPSGVDVLEAGTICEVTLHEVTQEAARLAVRLDLTAFEDGDDGPTVTGIKTSIPCVVSSGVPYLVGRFAEHDVARRRSWFAALGRSFGQRESYLRCYVRATRFDPARGHELDDAAPPPDDSRSAAESVTGGGQHPAETW